MVGASCDMPFHFSRHHKDVHVCDSIRTCVSATISLCERGTHLMPLFGLRMDGQGRVVQGKDRKDLGSN